MRVKSDEDSCVWTVVRGVVKVVGVSCSGSLHSFLQHFPGLLQKATGKGSVRGILQAKDNYWRRARQTLTPTFSAHKMKLVSVTETLQSL